MTEYEKMGGIYCQTGDYILPNLELKIMRAKLKKVRVIYAQDTKEGTAFGLKIRWLCLSFFFAAFICIILASGIFVYLLYKYVSVNSSTPTSLLGRVIFRLQHQPAGLGTRILMLQNPEEKNWLFSNTANGATSSTIIYSIIQTAIANGLIPQKYLEYVFTQIQYNKNIDTYVSWLEHIPEYCKVKKPQQK